ncbi:type VII secretion protein EccB [Paractinoplanes ferrugineus]|uniref:Type VII secretion protein EccB n=1 Tax=Paractinoplanes ferrugineus TaxID=113564 RepID=A0A919J2T5_9ACTN|nr:type VII secretion protein EccB [Actinoplanes ferrugineus]GIE11923.1 type VII secretion protein EccB [Actinoplanes ferrugineus]
MPSRQDQLHSYQYSLQRVVAALVTHDPDPSKSPLRRAGTTALVSLLIASLAVLGATIYGVLTGHSNVEPTDTSVVFQEKGSGARFVYLESDAKLHPVLNFTSGLLLASSDEPQLKSIAADRLAKVPLGPPLGIPDAPDSLPLPGSLITERWSICTDNKGEQGEARSTLLIGDKLKDGTVAQNGNEALLVQDKFETDLVYANRRFVIPDERLLATTRAFGWASQDPWQVSTAWLNAIPRGGDLVAPAIRNVGDDSPVGNLEVGQLVTGQSKEVSIILSDGAAVLTPLQTILMQVAGRGSPRDIGGDYLTMPTSKTKFNDTRDPGALPATVPALHPGNPGVACMTLPTTTADNKPIGDGLRIDPTLPSSEAVDTAGAQPNRMLADFWHLTRGRGVVAEVTATPEAPAGTGTIIVVTDTGRAYPLAGRSLLKKLGYDSDVAVQRVPSALISLLPPGPALDPARARESDVKTTSPTRGQ